MGIRIPIRQRAAAVGALALPPLLLVLAATSVFDDFPLGLVVLGGIALAVGAAFYSLLRRGPARVVGLILALLGLGGALFVILFEGGDDREGVALAIALALLFVCAREAFRVQVPLPDAEQPSRPVLFYNPKSGGGKAERFRLAEEAKARGIDAVELTRGADLEQLVRDAVAAGADGLAMAGGDGSQAIVAAVAAEHDLPYACIPAGTRNHFALDLGVDRDDVVGALEAFVDGGEHVVDLAEVNGRVFVNNVSLGVYAEAVQKEGYREAKLKTIVDTLPDAIGPEGEGLDLRWQGPGGHEHSGGAAILVSNNRYRLGAGVGSGTRPRIDDALLGVTVFGSPKGRGEGRRAPQRPWREWTAPEFEVESGKPVPAGIDGEAVTLESPVRFRIRAGVLRARIARAHPGASPSAIAPDSAIEGLRTLARIAAGRRAP